jgi:hypothetical protein
MERNELKNLNTEELAIEFKKRKSARTFAGFYIGIFIGIAVWSTVKNGFGLLTFLPILVAYFFIKTNTNYNEIKQEMASGKSTL